MSITFTQVGNDLRVNAEGMEIFCNGRTDTEENRLFAKQQLCFHWMQKRQGEIGFALLDANNNWRDDVYMDNTISRVEYTIGKTEGQAIVDLLEATWPDEVSDYNSHPDNSVSEFTPSRQPYANNSISWYDFSGEPSASQKSAYSLSYSAYMPWYGLKFDRVTEEVKLKAVVTRDGLLSMYPNALDNITLPEIWDMPFFARIHSKDGSVDERIDVYQNCPKSIMKEWCEDNSVTFPYDETDTSITDNLVCWGIVYNVTTGNIEHVKAYKRTYDT